MEIPTEIANEMQHRIKSSINNKKIERKLNRQDKYCGLTSFKWYIN